MNQSEESYQKLEAELNNAKSLLRIITETALYSYTLDVTTGIINEEIKNPNGFSFSQKVGLIPPFSYNDLIAKTQEVGIHCFYQGKIQDCSQEFLLDSYANGRHVVEVLLHEPIQNSYIRMSYLMTENQENHHIQALIIARDLSDIKKQESVGSLAMERFHDALHKKHDDLSNILFALSQDYQDVFSLSLNDQSIKAIKLTQMPKEICTENSVQPLAVFTRNYLTHRVYPEDKEKMRRILSIESIQQQLSQSKNFSGNYRIQKEDGSIHYFQYFFTTTEDRQQIVLALKNIDREVSESTARQNQVILSLNVINAISNIYHSIFLMDMITGRTTEIHAIPKIHQSIDSKNNDFKTILDIVETRFTSPEYQPILHSFNDTTTWKERFINKSTDSIEFVGLHKNWHRANLIVAQRDENNVPTHLIYAVQEINDQKQKELTLEKTLREVEAANHEILFSRSAMQSLGEEYPSIFYVNLRTNKARIEKLRTEFDLSHVSGRNISSLTYEEILNEYISAFVADEDKEEIRQKFSPAYLSRQLKLKRSWTNRFTCKDQKNQPFAVESHIVQANDDPDSFIIGLRNIEDLIRTERERQQALSDALAVAEKANHAKSSFLSNMSHDIRTPMNAIIGFTNLATNHLDNPDLVKDYLHKISTSSNHLLSLINDVLDMSRIESGKIKIEEKEIHLSEVVHDIRTMIQSNINAKSLDFTINTDHIVHETVYADKLRLNQVLINILTNSIKFTNPHGNISLSIIEKPSNKDNKADFEFHIKDNGIGIGKEFQKHIFEPFSREQTSTVSGIQGTGLGLAITKNIVSMMNGTITVDSEVGKGSEFTIYVSFRTLRQTENNSSHPQLRGARAIIVEKDFSACINVCKMVRETGMMCEWVTSGKEALLRAKHCQEAKINVTTFLIDDQLKDMDSLDVIRRLRSISGENTSIILLTSSDNSDLEEKAKIAGANSFCSKPIFMSELRDVLNNQFKKEEEEEMPSYHFPGKKILLVEDNQLNQEIAVEILKEADFVVDVAEDGDIAVKKMKKAKKGQYDLILMDIQMPRMNGYEATKAIRKLPNPDINNIPIVAMTANAFDEDRREAFASGMNDHIAKPIDLPSFFKTIAKFIEEKK